MDRVMQSTGHHHIKYRRSHVSEDIMPYIYSNSKVFALETGRRVPSGEGLFAFKIDDAADIKERINYYINGQRR